MRSSWKFKFYDKQLFKIFTSLYYNLKDSSVFSGLKIRSRRSYSFLPFLEENYELNVYNGCFYYKFRVPFFNLFEDKYPLLGEFAFTKKRSRLIHRFNATYKKNLKKKAALFKKRKKRLKTLPRKL